MSENDLSGLETVIKELVLPELRDIKQAIKEEHDYNEKTYVRKETLEAGHQQSDRLWTRRGVVATVFGVGSGFLWTIMQHVWR